MTGDVLTFTPGRSLRDAAKFMADHNVGAVVIIDPEQPGPGIITERDLVRSLGKGEIGTQSTSPSTSPRTRSSPTSNGTSRKRPTRWRGAASVTSWSSPTASSPGSFRCATSCACGGRARARGLQRDVSFLSLLTGSFSTPAADNPTVAMVEAATATSASTPATSTATSPRMRWATPSAAPGRWAGRGSTARCRTRSR